MNIAVAGGTGTVGRHVVTIARGRGHRVVSLSRAEGVDLVSGSGLAEALGGVDTVIDVANTQTLNGKKSVDFFTAVTGNMLRAGTAAGVRHHVALSIVGADKASAGYYAGKLAQENLVSNAGFPGPSCGPPSSMSSQRKCFSAVRWARWRWCRGWPHSLWQHARWRKPC